MRVRRASHRGETWRLAGKTWRLKLSPHAQLKPGQVDTLEAIASGGDLVSRQATGSGKSLTFMLPAVAGWQSGFAARQRCRDAQERAELPLPSLVLVLVPFVELMLDLQREADEYFAWLFETGRTPVRLRALAGEGGVLVRVAEAVLRHACDRVDACKQPWVSGGGYDRANAAMQYIHSSIEFSSAQCVQC